MTGGGAIEGGQTDRDLPYAEAGAGVRSSGCVLITRTEWIEEVAK